MEIRRELITASNENMLQEKVKKAEIRMQENGFEILKTTKHSTGSYCNSVEIFFIKKKG